MQHAPNANLHVSSCLELQIIGFGVLYAIFSHNPRGLPIWSFVVPGVPIWYSICSLILFLHFCSTIIWLCVSSGVLDENMSWAPSSKHRCGLMEMHFPRNHCLTARPFFVKFSMSNNCALELRMLHMVSVWFFFLWIGDCRSWIPLNICDVKKQWPDSYIDEIYVITLSDLWQQLMIWLFIFVFSAIFFFCYLVSILASWWVDNVLTWFVLCWWFLV
mgnify:CR=1 FL=1